MIYKRIFSILCLLCSVLISLSLQAQDIQSSSVEYYEKGLTLFENGLFEEAADAFDTFVNQQKDHNLRSSSGFYLARSKAYLDSVNTRTYYENYIRSYPRTQFTSQLLFELGNRMENNDQYGQAIEHYQRAIKLGLNDEAGARTYYRLAEASAKNGQNVQARNHFLELADKYPRSEWAPKALYARGRLYLSENKYDSSTVAFETLKKRYPNNEMTRRVGTALGESYYQQGRYEEAITAFKDALPNLEGDLKTKAVYLIAESYNYLNKLDQASSYYLQHINRTKGTDEEYTAHYGLGWVYHKQEIYHWASDEFGKAAEGSGKISRKALYYKAVNEKLGSRYRQSLESFRTFGDRFKKGFWVEKAYYEWAVTAYEVGRYSEAIEVLLPLVRSDESLEWKSKIFTLLGESYFANKEYTRALQAFDEAEKVTDVDDAIKRQARFQKAWVQYSNQAYEPAQSAFEKIYDNAPNTDLGKEALFWSADSYYNMKHYGPASSQYAAFIERYPDHKLAGPAHYSLGWSYFKMGNYQKAIQPFKTFRENYEPPEEALYPYDTDTQLRIGDSYYAVGNYSEAISNYQKAVGAEPGGDYAMFQIANSYYRAEKSYEAVKTFRKFLRIYPQSQFSQQSQYNIAYIYLNTENYSRAVEEFQTVINKYPNTSWAARAQYNIGDAYYNAGDYEKAISSYKEVMEKYPESEYIIEAVNGIQYAQLSGGKADSSSAVLEDFLADNPRSSMADRLRFRQADTRMQTGDYKGAIKEFQQYLRITNSEELQPDAHFNLANAYEKTGQVEKAVQEYQIIVSDFPNSERSSSALTSLGAIASRRGNYQQSFDYFKQLSQKGAKYQQEANIGMGNAQLQMENTDQAGGYYQTALDTNPNYDPAKVGLAKVEIQENNYSEARNLLSTVAESNTTEVGAEAQYLLGMIAQQQQSYEKAVKAYADVNVLYKAFDGWVSKAMLNQAKCYIRLNKQGEARSTLNTLVDNYPDTPQAGEARKLLNEE
ncbi:Tfp pilus assembly protein PilF [Fodinibius salinus]|uniref:Tfp pilus assembly protein PilF n=1 Tax=Fodinibius salinus TaxID=860790 RepID=A0A5D3YGX4_9BACT|nr:tetratricopeptide repeat protein [Fodinibius salinus]TYP91674.1 Tfp pilus assembly protein PilF [Fodinibius salinus]